MVPWLVALVVAAPRTVAASEPAGPGPTATDAVGSDEAPLPAPPPAPGGRLVRGVFTGKGWFELGPSLLQVWRLPGDRRLLSAGLTGVIGARPHRHFGAFTGFTTWVGDLEQSAGTDEDGNELVVSAAVPTTAWDIVGVRVFAPIGRRLEPSADLATGIGFERRPFSGRRVWGSLHGALALAVWVAPTLSLRFSADYRLLARTTALRHFVGGTATFSIHF